MKWFKFKKNPKAKTKVKIELPPVPEKHPKLYMKTTLAEANGVGLNVPLCPSLIESKFYKLFNDAAIRKSIAQLNICTLDDGFPGHVDLNYGMDINNIPAKNKLEVRTMTLTTPSTSDYKGHGSWVVGAYKNSLAPIFRPGGFCTAFLIDTNHLHLKVLDNGMGFVDDIIRALKYILGLPPNKRPHMISMSLGIAIKEEDYADDVKECNKLFDQLQSEGIHVAASSGNSGLHIPGFTDPIADRVWWPARHTSVDAIANIKLDYKMSPTSSQGDVDACSFGDNEISWSNDQSGYAKMTGTSMALPRHGHSWIFLIGYLNAIEKIPINDAIKNWKTHARRLGIFKDVDKVGKDINTGEGVLVWNK